MASLVPTSACIRTPVLLFDFLSLIFEFRRSSIPSLLLRWLSPVKHSTTAAANVVTQHELLLLAQPPRDRLASLSLFSFFSIEYLKLQSLPPLLFLLKIWNSNVSLSYQNQENNQIEISKFLLLPIPLSSPNSARRLCLSVAAPIRSKPCRHPPKSKHHRNHLTLLSVHPLGLSSVSIVAFLTPLLSLYAVSS